MPPPSEKCINVAPAALGRASEYSAEERAWLLRLAHTAIEYALSGRDLNAAPLNPHLAELRGAFTTLHAHGELRGCVGYVAPMYPLYRTIAETAVAAAFNDTRFWSVTAAELPHLKIDISVLSPLCPIKPNAIEIGRHGLVVTMGSFRGLLLPQVATEHHWDAKTFLEQTCMKAGLEPDDWQHGATLEAFTAEVFGEE